MYGNLTTKQSTLLVFVDDQKFTFNHGGSQTGLWQLATVTFTASDASAIVAFRADAGQNSNSVLLDGVVPEASSLILWGQVWLWEAW